MELVNLKTGQYINTIQWTGNNAKSIKHFLTKSVNFYFDDILNDSACSLLSYNDVHLCYQRTLNHSLTISYQKKHSTMHHIITISIHDYITFHPYNHGCSRCIITISPQDIKNMYSKPNIIKHGFVNNKTGVHYIGYQWNGSLANFPSYINQSLQDANKGKILVDNKRHYLYLKFSSEINGKAKKLPIKLHYWLLLEAGNDFENKLYCDDYRILSPNNAMQKYHLPKNIKLPKYLFTVIETTGEYSDIDTEVIGTSATYVGAKKIMSKAESLYSQIHDDFKDDDPTFDITPTKTRGFNKNDIYIG